MTPIDPVTVYIVLLCIVVVQLGVIAWLLDQLTAARRRCRTCAGCNKVRDSGWCASCGDAWGAP